MTLPDRPPPAAPRKLDPAKLQPDEQVLPRRSFDPPEVAGWLRGGGCTLGCGACCEAVILALRPYAGPPEGFADWQHWLELHGITLFGSPDNLLASIPIACSKLGPEKECTVFGTDERPTMCGTWPEHPAMVKLRVADVCTYEFIPLEMTPPKRRRS